VIDRNTAAVVDGYTRSATTFAVYAFQLAQPQPVRLAHHLHAVAQLKEAARRQLPTLVVVREPRGAVLSQVVREPGVDLLDALFAYRRFHQQLLPLRDSFCVAGFDEVTGNFGGVITRLNAHFGTDYRPFMGEPDELALCRRMIEMRPALSPVLLGFESGEVSRESAVAHLETLPEERGEAVWMPSPERERAKAALEEAWLSPALEPARRSAAAVHADFIRST
jgi:hypothetical protein